MGAHRTLAVNMLASMRCFIIYSCKQYVASSALEIPTHRLTQRARGLCRPWKEARAGHIPQHQEARTGAVAALGRSPLALAPRASCSGIDKSRAVFTSA